MAEGGRYLEYEPPPGNGRQGQPTHHVHRHAPYAYPGPRAPFNNVHPVPQQQSQTQGVLPGLETLPSIGSRLPQIQLQRPVIQLQRPVPGSVTPLQTPGQSSRTSVHSLVQQPQRMPPQQQYSNSAQPPQQYYQNPPVYQQQRQTAPSSTSSNPNQQQQLLHSPLPPLQHSPFMQHSQQFKYVPYPPRSVAHSQSSSTDDSGPRLREQLQPQQPQNVNSNIQNSNRDMPQNQPLAPSPSQSQMQRPPQPLPFTAPMNPQRRLPSTDSLTLPLPEQRRPEREREREKSQTGGFLPPPQMTGLQRSTSNRQQQRNSQSHSHSPANPNSSLQNQQQVTRSSSFSSYPPTSPLPPASNQSLQNQQTQSHTRSSSFTYPPASPLQSSFSQPQSYSQQQHSSQSQPLSQSQHSHSSHSQSPYSQSPSYSQPQNPNPPSVASSSSQHQQRRQSSNNTGNNAYPNQQQQRSPVMQSQHSRSSSELRAGQQILNSDANFQSRPVQSQSGNLHVVHSNSNPNQGQGPSNSAGPSSQLNQNQNNMHSVATSQQNQTQQRRASDIGGSGSGYAQTSSSQQHSQLQHSNLQSQSVSPHSNLQSVSPHSSLPPPPPHSNSPSHLQQLHFQPPGNSNNMHPYSNSQQVYTHHSNSSPVHSQSSIHSQPPPHSQLSSSNLQSWPPSQSAGPSQIPAPTSTPTQPGWTYLDTNNNHNTNPESDRGASRVRANVSQGQQNFAPSRHNSAAYTPTPRFPSRSSVTTIDPASTRLSVEPPRQQQQNNLPMVSQPIGWQPPQYSQQQQQQQQPLHVHPAALLHSHQSQPRNQPSTPENNNSPSVVSPRQLQLRQNSHSSSSVPPASSSMNINGFTVINDSNRPSEEPSGVGGIAPSATELRPTAGPKRSFTVSFGSKEGKSGVDEMPVSMPMSAPPGLVQQTKQLVSPPAPVYQPSISPSLNGNGNGSVNGMVKAEPKPKPKAKTSNANANSNSNLIPSNSNLMPPNSNTMSSNSNSMPPNSHSMPPGTSTFRPHIFHHHTLSASSSTTTSSSSSAPAPAPAPRRGKVNNNNPNGGGRKISPVSGPTSPVMNTAQQPQQPTHPPAPALEKIPPFDFKKLLSSYSDILMASDTMIHRTPTIPNTSEAVNRMLETANFGVQMLDCLNTNVANGNPVVPVVPNPVTPVSNAGSIHNVIVNPNSKEPARKPSTVKLKSTPPLPRSANNNSIIPPSSMTVFALQPPNHQHVPLAADTNVVSSEARPMVDIKSTRSIKQDVDMSGSDTAMIVSTASDYAAAVSSGPVPAVAKMGAGGKRNKMGAGDDGTTAEGGQLCLGCGATTTPEWRRGPMGPRTLCNACGLVYAKLIKKRVKEGQKDAGSESNAMAVMMGGNVNHAGSAYTNGHDKTGNDSRSSEDMSSDEDDEEEEGNDDGEPNQQNQPQQAQPQIIQNSNPYMTPAHPVPQQQQQQQMHQIQNQQTYSYIPHILSYPHPQAQPQRR